MKIQTFNIDDFLTSEEINWLYKVITLVNGVFIHSGEGDYYLIVRCNFGFMKQEGNRSIMLPKKNKKQREELISYLNNIIQK